MSATIIDPPTTVQVMLDGESRWNIANHSGTVDTPNKGPILLNEEKPHITIIYDEQQVLEGAINNIYILQVTQVPDYSNYATRRRRDENVKLSVTTKAGTRPDVLAKFQEARRIFETLSISIGSMIMPTGYNNCFSQVWVTNIREQSDTVKNHHQIAMDVELRHIGVVLAT